MGFIKKFLEKRKHLKTIKNENFPEHINGEWFAYQVIEKSKGKEQLPPYFNEAGDYINYNVGDIVLMIINDRFKAFYKITKYWREGNDHAMWDDGRKYNLELHHVESVSTGV